MIAKKPIVATKAGGIKNIIQDERNGFLVQVENPEELASAIGRYIDSKDSIEKIVNYNYNYVIQKYNIKNVAIEHKNIFDK